MCREDNATCEFEVAPLTLDDEDADELLSVMVRDETGVRDEVNIDEVAGDNEGAEDTFVVDDNELDERLDDGDDDTIELVMWVDGDS